MRARSRRWRSDRGAGWVAGSPELSRRAWGRWWARAARGCVYSELRPHAKPSKRKQLLMR